MIARNPERVPDLPLRSSARPRASRRSCHHDKAAPRGRQVALEAEVQARDTDGQRNAVTVGAADAFELTSDAPTAAAAIDQHRARDNAREAKAQHCRARREIVV